MPSSTFFGALALELRPGVQAARPALAPAQAAQLADGIGHDLAALKAEAADCDLAVLAAHYDPVELLRPGWPVHAALDALVLRAPMAADRGGRHSRILAFGAHEGVLPDPVPAPDPDYARGTMRLLPLLLRGGDGDGERIAGLAQALEEILLERGMAGAATALFAQEAFAAPIEHARYLTLHDLCALMAMQYEHAGLGPLWPLIEAALLAPQEEVWLDAPPEPLARHVDGEVRIALLDAEGWRANGFGPVSAGGDADRLERAFAMFEARQRQFAAVLAAQGIGVSFDHCQTGTDPRVTLSKA